MGEISEKQKAALRQLNQSKITNIKFIEKIIINRYKFYVSSLRFLIIVWLLSFFSLICIIVVSFSTSIKEKLAWYIPASFNGQVITIEDLAAPSQNGRKLTDEFVTEWVLNAIPNIYSYDFVNSEGNFTKVVRYFTPDSFKEYSRAVQESKLLDTINTVKTSVIGYGCNTGKQILVNKGVKTVQNFPLYVWEFKIPLVTRNVGLNQKFVMIGELDIRVQRVPTLLSKSGIAIWQFVIKVDDDAVISDDGDFDSLCRKYFKV